MSKRLITDRDVLEGRCGARIVLDGATLITPAARDRALRAGIAIVEADAPARAACARCGSAGCAGGCGTACARCGSATCTGGCGDACTASGAAAMAADLVCALPDGLYLVRIEGGRAVSTLPAAGPGLLSRSGGALARAARSG